MTSIKGYSSVTNKQNMGGSNHNLYLVNAFTKFGEILLVCSRDIEQKRISVVSQGPYL